jgi:hypothetical protein
LLQDEKEQKKKFVEALKAAESNSAALVASMWRKKVQDRRQSRVGALELVQTETNIAGKSKSPSGSSKKNSRRMSMAERIAQNSTMRRTSATGSAHLPPVDDSDTKNFLLKLWKKKTPNAVVDLNTEIKELEGNQKSAFLIKKWRQNAKMKSKENQQKEFVKAKEEAENGYHTD